MKTTFLKVSICCLLCSSITVYSQDDRNYAPSYESLQQNVSGHYLTAIGKKSLRFNTNGVGNTAIGYMSMMSNTTGYFNTAVGSFTLKLAATTRENTAIGHKSQENATGHSNVSLGYRSLQQVTGSRNIAIGKLTMSSSTNSSENTMIGGSSGVYCSSSYRNSCLGHMSLSGLRTGNENVAIGVSAGGNISTGSRNIIIGPYTKGSNVNSYNIIMGYRSSAPTGDNNIVIGKKITLPAGTSNAMNIGGVLYGTGLQSTLPEDPTATPAGGRIGINVITPTATLDVEGDAKISTNLTSNYIISNNDIIVGSNNKQFILHTQQQSPNDPPILFFAPKLSDGSAFDWSKQIVMNSEGSLLVTGGKIGIGTVNPQNALDVNGTIHAKEVKVDLNGWADFVFEKNYNLPSLAEVNQFIEDNGHLPNIPSAQEVKENGVNLAEMQAKLLQKVEELTLYSIQQQKEIQSLKLELESLKNK
jgi:hypothetical protein